MRMFRAITTEERNTRLYPSDGVGASLLGFYTANQDAVVAEGLELSLDGYLAGTEGLAREMKNADPSDPMGRVPVRAPVHGQSLVLSLDTELQAICERELVAAVEKYKSKSGSVLILDPHTGDVLAAASFPVLPTRRTTTWPEGTWNTLVHSQR